jgi:galactose-1-phosphate uridylyltransferase
LLAPKNASGLLIHGVELTIALEVECGFPVEVRKGATLIRFGLKEVDSVQLRFDPLTGAETRINPSRAHRVKQAAGEVMTQAAMEEMGHLSRPGCPFCTDRVEESTSTFPPDMVPEGKIRQGQSIVVPNIHPFALHHGVAIMGHQHFRRLDEFESELLTDNLLATRDFVRAAARARPRARYPVYILNYMPPSSGSIVHPHSQVWVEHRPVPDLRHILRQSRSYFQRWGRSYWDDLSAQEKRQGERFIGENTSLSVLTSFAPRGYREVQFIFKGVSSLVEVETRQAADMAEALRAVLLGYHALGVGSFNLASFSASARETPDHFRLSFRLISRPYPTGVYTNDSGPAEKLYGFRVVDTLPEEVAASVRPYFIHR